MREHNVRCTLNVNATMRDTLVRVDATLLEVLRENLDLTGTKRGCNHGVCGACNVLLDGTLVRSCLMLAVDVGERAIVTVEAVAGAATFFGRAARVDRRRRDPVRILHAGFRHGADRALRARPKADARRHSRGDLGQPVPMFRLCENRRSGRASRRGCAVRDPDTAARRSPPRLDAADKATGRARYADDIRLPGMLHAAIHTSQHAHARIVGYRTDAARALPGVHAIVTGADIAGTRCGRHRQGRDDARARQGPLCRRAGRGRRGHRRRDGDRARPPRSRSTTSRCPRVLSPDAALARDAPILHEEFAAYVKTVDGGGHGNIVFESDVAEGDVDARIRANAMRSSRERSRRRRSITSTWKPNGCVADVDAAGRITLYVELPVGAPRAAARRRGARRADGADSRDRDARRRRVRRQARVEPALDRRVARARGAPPGEARAVADAGLRGPALAASRAHLDEDRRAARRHDPRARRAHRRSTAARMPTKAPPVLAFALLMSRGPYRIPNVRAHGAVVYTNKLRAGSFRGFGNPQATLRGRVADRRSRRVARHRSLSSCACAMRCAPATPHSAASRWRPALSAMR